MRDLRAHTDPAQYDRAIGRLPPPADHGSEARPRGGFRLAWEELAVLVLFAAVSSWLVALNLWDAVQTIWSGPAPLDCRRLP
jgi:hypothetical protein